MVGRYDEVPYHVDVPGWLESWISSLLASSKCPPMRVEHDHGAVKHPRTQSECGVDRFYFALGIDAARVQEVLATAWTEARNDLERDQGVAR